MVTDLILYAKRIKEHGLTVEADFPPKLLDLQDGDISFVDRVLVNLRAHIVTKQILVQGTMDASIQSECARCLSPVVQKIHLAEVLFTYEYENQDFVDLSPEVRDELLLALPMRLLCREDCKGLCPRCRKNWNEGTCGCSARSAKSHGFEALEL